MNSVELELKHEIERFFGIPKHEIKEFKNLEGSNHVYSFHVYSSIEGKQKYVIKKLINTSIMDWEQEKAAYISLKHLDITDELVCYENGIKISRYIDSSKSLSYSESDMIDALDLIRTVHESGISIKFKYDIIENMEKYILHCDQKSESLDELKRNREKIETIQAMLNKLKVRPVLCHGDACVSGNFLRLSDGSIRIIDWEQAGMADPFLDIAIATLHQGFENVDPVWCLRHYLKRTPNKQEYFRLYSFLALNSYALMAWCISDENAEGYQYYLDSANKYRELSLEAMSEGDCCIW